MGFCGSNEKSPEKVTVFEKNLNTSIVTVKSHKDFKKGEEVTVNGRINGINLLAYQGASVENNYYDCYGLVLSFSQNKDDSLSLRRKDFFAKFFLFDTQELDIM